MAICKGNAALWYVKGFSYLPSLSNLVSCTGKKTVQEGKVLVVMLDDDMSLISETHMVEREN